MAQICKSLARAPPEGLSLLWRIDPGNTHLRLLVGPWVATAGREGVSIGDGDYEAKEDRGGWHLGGVYRECDRQKISPHVAGLKLRTLSHVSGGFWIMPTVDGICIPNSGDFDHLQCPSPKRSNNVEHSRRGTIST